jgi:Fe2+ transport system protein FeoA
VVGRKRFVGDKTAQGGRSEMTLDELESGQSGRVVSIDCENIAAKRLMEMGVVPGIQISVLKSAPFGDPIEIRLLGYNLAVRRNEASSIVVSKN